MELSRQGQNLFVNMDEQNPVHNHIWYNIDIDKNFIDAIIDLEKRNFIVIKSTSTTNEYNATNSMVISHYESDVTIIIIQNCLKTEIKCELINLLS